MVFIISGVAPANFVTALLVTSPTPFPIVEFLTIPSRRVPFKLGNILLTGAPLVTAAETGVAPLVANCLAVSESFN